MRARRCASVRRLLFAAVVLTYLVGTRWPLAPKYLYYFDSANFALALHEFDPAKHQPQPPGYPLFVALIRLIHVFVARPEHVLLLAGIAASFGAVLVTYLLARDLFGRAAGFIGAALLASDPVFWFGGITNQVRLFLSLSTATVLFFAWRALARPEQARWLYAGFGALGIAAGFRPELAVLLLPAMLWVWFRGGRSPRRLMIALAALAAAALPWIWVTLRVVGGVRRMGAILWNYAEVQFDGTSALFGAAPDSAWKMFLWAVEWNLFGALVWLWAVPLAWRRLRPSEISAKTTLLVLAFLPQFLFSAFIHIGDPDQALATITVLCVAGAAVLAALWTGVPDRRLAGACAAIVALHSVLFFYPPTRVARAGSYRAAAAVDRMNTGALSAIDALGREGPITIVHYGSSVATRHLSYYFPNTYVDVLPGRPDHASPGRPSQVFYGHENVSLPEGASGLIGRGSKRVVFLLPWDARPEDLPGARRFGAVYYFDRKPGSALRVGPYNLLPVSAVTAASVITSP
jgi:hypothetical protein